MTTIVWTILRAMMSKDGLRIIAVTLLGLIGLTGCDKKSKDPLQGTRETVFANVSTIRIDRSDATIVLPEPKVNESWATVSSSERRVIDAPAALNAGLQEAWRVNMGTGSSSTTRLLNGPIIADNKVFAIDAEGIVSAVNLQNGEIVWQAKTLPEDEKVQPFGGGVVFNNGVIYTATAAAEVLAIQAQTGEIIWRRKVTAPVRSAPAVHDGRVYVITINNQLEVLSTNRGDMLWSHSGTLEIAGLLGGTSPTLEKGVAIVPYTSGEIFALRAENGYPLWTESLSSVHVLDSVAALSHIKARPAVHRNKVILISHGGRTTALDLRSGKPLWSKDISGIRSPTVVDNYIFMIASDGQLVCLEQERGDVLWVKQLPAVDEQNSSKEKLLWSGPTLTSQGLVVVSSDGRLLFCSPQNGDIIKTLPIDGSLMLSPIVAQQTLVILTENADLIAYR